MEPLGRFLEYSMESLGSILKYTPVYWVYWELSETSLGAPFTIIPPRLFHRLSHCISGLGPVPLLNHSSKLNQSGKYREAPRIGEATNQSSSSPQTLQPITVYKLPKSQLWLAASLTGSPHFIKSKNYQTKPCQFGIYTKSFSYLVQWVSEILIYKVSQLYWGGNPLIVVHCYWSLKDK